MVVFWALLPCPQVPENSHQVDTEGHVVVDHGEEREDVGQQARRGRDTLELLECLHQDEVGVADTSRAAVAATSSR